MNLTWHLIHSIKKSKWCDNYTLLLETITFLVTNISPFQGTFLRRSFSSMDPANSQDIYFLLPSSEKKNYLPQVGEMIKTSSMNVKLLVCFWVPVVWGFEGVPLLQHVVVPFIKGDSVEWKKTSTALSPHFVILNSASKSRFFRYFPRTQSLSKCESKPPRNKHQWTLEILAHRNWEWFLFEPKYLMRFVSVIIHPNHHLTRWARIRRVTNHYP